MIGHISFRQGTYEKYLPKGSVIYDLGAHTGQLAIDWHEMGYEVYAFEGAPSNMAALLANVGEKKNLVVYNIALGTKDEDVVTGFNDSVAPPGQYPEQKISYRRLEKFVDDNNLPWPKMIKMDIEGMESVVLNTCKYLIFSIRPIWQLSLHESMPYKATHYPGFVKKEEGGFDFKTFKTAGYNLYDLEMNPVEELKGDEEYFIIPKELDADKSI